MRIKAKGLHWSPVTLADGSKKTYYYAWRGGPRLNGEYGSPEFIASYNAAIATKVVVPEGKLLSLLQGYQASQDFLGLRERTRADYIKQIEKIEQKFGDAPVKALADPRTRGIFMDWRDELALRSKRQADYAWTVLARVLSWAKDRGKITVNPCERGGRVYHGTRVDFVWSVEDEAAFLEHAPAHLHLPLLLALWTGQRQGDLLRLPWSAYNGASIRLRQSKTGARVEIPVGAPLKAALDAAKRHGPIMLTSTDARPWTPDGFRASWGKACKRPPSRASRSTICAAPPSPGSRWSAAPRPRSRPSPGTACVMCARSSTRTICTATSSWHGARSPSLKWATRSEPRGEK